MVPDLPLVSSEPLGRGWQLTLSHTEAFNLSLGYTLGYLLGYTFSASACTCASSCWA